MAAKVNVKFVVILGASLALVLAGMAGVMYMVLKKSGEDWALKGDEAAAAQDWEAADEAYSYAVAHDRSNVEWLKKWLDAMGHVVIDNEINFESRFNTEYAPVMRQLAHMGRTADLQAHIDFLELTLERVQGSPGGSGWRVLLSEARTSQNFFAAGGAPEPGVATPEPWHKLYRYSGIALSALYARNLTENEDEVAQAERDLRLATAANPTDADTAVELSNLYEAMSTRRASTPPIDLAASERLAQQSRAVLEASLDRDPGAVDAAIELLRLDIKREATNLNARAGGRRLTQAQVDEALRPYTPRLDAIADELMRRAPDGIPQPTLDRFAQVERLVAPTERLRRLAEIVETWLQADPDNVTGLLILGGIRQFRGEHREVIELSQRLIDLPPKPMGIEGMRLFSARPEAIGRQAAAALSLYETSEDEQQRTAALADAGRFREALAAVVPADSAQLLKLDARRAFLQQAWQEAERLLIEVNQRTGGNDREVMWWLAQTEAALGKPGEARRLLELLDDAEPNNFRYMVALAAIESDLKNTERARAIAEELLTLFPNEPEVQQIVDQITGQNDPIRMAVDEYRRIAEGEAGTLGDPDAALAGLEAAFEANGHHPNLGRALLNVYLIRGELENARGVAARVIEAHPDDTSFAGIAESLSGDQLVTVLADLIRSGPTTDAQKALALYALYRNSGMTAEADRELASAVAIAPRQREVVEAQFLDAASKGDTATMARLVTVAREQNIDGMQGETFNIQMLVFESKHTEAVAALERAVTRAPNEAWLWRQLGLERINVGRLDDAATALRRALEIRPNDVEAARELTGLLGMRGFDAQALEVARKHEPFGRGDMGYLNMLWILEARAGNRTVALEGREALRRRDQSLAWNNQSLAELYMDLGRWADARALIDEMRAAQDSLALVGLDARWHADQGDFVSAQRAYTAYIGSLPPDQQSSDPYLALAAFMQGREQLTLAEAALEQGRLVQDPATMDCDRMLGDILTVGQRLTDAVVAYTRVIEGNADTPEFTFRKRLVEALINLERFDEARTHMAAMAELARTDRNVMLLTAELARKSGDRPAALRQMDECVRQFPEDPIVYYQRAELLLDDPARAQDALADFDTAIRKAPNFWQALRNRSGVYRQLGRTDDAVNDLRRAVVAAGTDGEAVTQLLGELMYLRRVPEAVSAADEAVAQRPTDVVFIQRVASVFAMRSEWQAAARFSGRAFELRKEPAIAQRYLDTLLNQRPPQTRTAEDVLTAMGAEVTRNPGLLAASVMVNIQRNRVAEAERDATLAFDLVSANPNAIINWHTTMVRAFGDTTAHQAYLRRLASVKATTALKDWPLLFLAIIQSRVTETSAMAIEALNRLANEGQPMEVRLNAMRSIGSTVYGYGDYSQAAEIWTTALQAFPDDWEMNNNLAFVLTEHLDRAQEGLPYALKALQQQPRSASVQDTVGWAYFKAGNLDKAEEHLWTAARLSRDAAEQAGVVVHIIEVDIAQQDKPNATRYLTYLRRLIAESPWMDASFKTRADELEARIGSLP